MHELIKLFEGKLTQQRVSEHLFSDLHGYLPIRKDILRQENSGDKISHLSFSQSFLYT